MTKFLRYLLVASLFVLALAVMSNSFDLDLGWHLRFGQAFWNTGAIPFLNSSTWTFAGRPWVNHEWGGDLLVWKIYSSAGYFALLIIMSASITAAFLFIHRALKQKLTVFALVASLAGVWFTEQTLVMRLAMLTPLFLTLTIFILERAGSKKTIVFLPPLLYIWSILHGSWILGFITAAIYAAGLLAENVLGNRFPWRISKPKDRRPFRNIVIAAAVAAPLPLLNPYGFGVYREVASYFTNVFYRQFIIEWLPIYAPPVYARSLVAAGALLVLFCFAWKSRRLSLPQILLFCALFFAGVTAKRNMILLVLVSVPLVAAFAESALKRAAEKIGRDAWKVYERTAIAFGCVGLFLALLLNGLTVRFSKDVWSDDALLALNRVPAAAIRFLAHEDNAPQFVFNYFNWGGALVWMDPGAKIFLDGSGTVTWRRNGNETIFEEYLSIFNEPGGLAKLAAGPAQYAILPNSPASALGRDLDRSAQWQRVYADSMAVVWERLK
jgi:hypothetical protein